VYKVGHRVTTPQAEDWDLLNEYATQNSEASFHALVERHAGMVYHAALRQIGDPHLAEEVTQAVFIALAQKASRLSSRVLVCGWLYRATRYAVLNLARAERSRRRHEQEVIAMQTLVPPPEQAHPIWEHISPFLDEALNELSASDRHAILVRYFGGRSHKETSQKLGISEDAAKKRLSRALDRLRSILSKRGVVTPALALTAAFAACGSKAAPTGLTSSIASAALSHAASASASGPLLAAGILSQMALSKAKYMALTAIAALLLAFGARETLHFRQPAPPPAAAAPQPAPSVPPPQGIVVWDKTIAAPTINTGNAPLQQALDTISAQAGAYWSVDYVLYDTDDALRRLLDALRNGGTLSSCGWTNLGGAQWKLGDFNVVTARSDNNSAGPDTSNNAQAPDTVAMTAVIQNDPSDTAAISSEKKQAMQEAIERSMRQGVAEGTLVPARLLAEASVVPRLKDPSTLTPTREATARAARDAQAFWTIIYTLRPSPLAGVGLRISHPPPAIDDGNPPFPPFVYPHPTMNPDLLIFDLSDADLAAHQQAVNAYLQQARSK